jgi:hypothetical protein
MIDLILVVILSLSLLFSLYLGDTSTTNQLIAGLLGYLGAKHTNSENKLLSNQNSIKKEDDKNSTS